MSRRGKCRCGKILVFERTARGYKVRCPDCQAVVRLRAVEAAQRPQRAGPPPLPRPTPELVEEVDSLDMLDLRPLFNSIGYQGTNPVADGYLSFQSDGAGNTKVYFDPDAAGAVHQWPWLITVLDNVQPSGLHMQGDWFFH